jgi:DNA-directed RNA polymerase
MNSLDRQQLKFEVEAIANSLEGFFTSGDWSNEMSRAINVLTTEITRERESLLIGRGRLPEFGLPFLSIRAEALGAITWQAIYHCFGIAKDYALPELQMSSRTVGRWVHAAYRYHHLMKALGFTIDVLDPQFETNLSGRNHNPNAQRRSRKLASRLNDPASWEDRQWDLHTGAKLVDMAVRTEELVQYVKERRPTPGSHALVFLAPTRAGGKWLTSRSNPSRGWSAPLYYPMVRTPLDWRGSLTDGGYLTNRATRSQPRCLDLHLVKRRQPGQADFLRRANLGRVLAAVNGLQRTAWAINGDVARALKNRQSQIEATALSVAQSSRRQSQIAAQITTLQRRLLAAERLTAFDQIFFPYQTDFRGRIYAVPQVFNPQSDDIGRALLTFAEGHPLGNDGEYWLRVHIANKFGLNKASMHDRVNWSERHLDAIRSFALKPEDDSHPFWNTEEPWQLLAACIEWIRLERGGSKFKSSLPVSLDGTCNGLQHLSALIRDPFGGAATNLTANPEPQDIYAAVAEVAKGELQARASLGDREASKWIAKMSRKLVKRPTMTTPYGVTRRGVATQLFEDGFTSTWSESLYLSALLDTCIARVVVGGRQVMHWLQQATRQIAAVNKEIFWETPSGFPLVIAYRTSHRRVKVGSRAFTVIVQNKSLPINRTEQVRSVMSRVRLSETVVDSR